MPSEDRSLYERVGGEEGIARLVNDFYDRILADPLLKPFFETTSMEKLLRMQREFFSAALGGPARYSGRPMSHAHHGRGIGRRHFSRFVEHLLETLEGFELEDESVRAIIARVNTYADEIMGGHGLAG